MATFGLSSGLNSSTSNKNILLSISQFEYEYSNPILEIKLDNNKLTLSNTEESLSIEEDVPLDCAELGAAAGAYAYVELDWSFGDALEYGLMMQHACEVLTFVSIMLNKGE